MEEYLVQLVNDVGEVKGGVRSIVERLDKMNGTVAEHEGFINNTKLILKVLATLGAIGLTILAPEAASLIGGLL